MSTGKNCEDEVTAKRRALCPPKLSSTSIAFARRLRRWGVQIHLRIIIRIIIRRYRCFNKMPDFTFCVLSAYISVVCG